MLAEKSQSAQAAQDKVKVRREVYLQFLNKANDVERRLATWWEEAPVKGTRPPEIIDAFDDDLHDLGRLLHVVLIEGPDDIGEAANQYYLRLTTEVPRIAFGLVQLHATADGMSLYEDSVRVRQQDRNKMIDAARKAL